MIKNQKVTQI